jgi:hypothetical protein
VSAAAQLADPLKALALLDNQPLALLVLWKGLNLV